MIKPDRANRASYIPLSSFILLDQACQVIAAAFDEYPYHVGSSTQRTDWRDVDVRLMIDSGHFEEKGLHDPAFWSLFCLAVSEYLSRVSGLPVDFQVQRTEQANRRYGDQFRNPLGTGRRYAGGPEPLEATMPPENSKAVRHERREPSPRTTSP